MTTGIVANCGRVSVPSGHCVAPFSVEAAGREKERQAPSPTRPSPQTLPPWRSTMRATMGSPMPVPGDSAGCRAWSAPADGVKITWRSHVTPLWRSAAEVSRSSRD
jgi:hypothetical protein